MWCLNLQIVNEVLTAGKKLLTERELSECHEVRSVFIRDAVAYLRY